MVWIIGSAIRFHEEIACVRQRTPDAAANVMRAHMASSKKMASGLITPAKKKAVARKRKASPGAGP